MSKSENSFVVVGGGIAGVSCAEQLGISCPEQPVVLISASPLVKSCINIKQVAKVLQDFEVEEKVATYLESQYPNIKVILSTVVGLNCQLKQLYLSDGSTLEYGKLCLCTGGKPKIILKDSPLVIGIRDTETVQVLQEKLVNSRRILVVGNGGIATELVYELRSCQVLWAIRDKSVGATFFDAGAAEFFRPQISQYQDESKGPCKRLKYIHSDEKTSSQGKVMGSALGPDWSTGIQMPNKTLDHRVTIEYECEVAHVYTTEEAKQLCLTETKLENDDFHGIWPLYVQLTNGHIYGCDFVVSATGVIPYLEDILKNNQFKVASDGGLEVDNQMRTSHPDVYAAGDVCTAVWEHSQNWLQMRLWTQARQMGMYAAQCMYLNCRREENIMDICFDLFTHVTRFFGFKVVLLGLFNCQKLEKNCELLVRMTPGHEYIKLVLQNGRVQGAILVGETDLEETFENLILNQIDVSALGEDLLNPDVDIEDYFD